MKLLGIVIVLLVVSSQTKSFRLPYGPYVSRIGIVDFVWPRSSKECFVILCLRCNLIFTDHIETESLVNALDVIDDMKIYNSKPKVQKSSKEYLQNILNPANNLEEFGVRMM